MLKDEQLSQTSLWIGWEEIGPRRQSCTLEMITGHGISGPLFSHSSLAFCPVPQNSYKMAHEDGAVVELKMKKKFKKENSEYMRKISSQTRPALNVKISPTRGFCG